MDEPLTEELLDELLTAPSPESFLDSHGVFDRRLSEYLKQLLEEKGLVQAQVVRTAGLNATYGYQIFTGDRSRPGRDKVLALALAMGLNLRECNRALQAAQCNELYCKNRRDAIIIFAIEHGYSLQLANETLYEFGEEAIS